MFRIMLSGVVGILVTILIIISLEKVKIIEKEQTPITHTQIAPLTGEEINQLQNSALWNAVQKWRTEVGLPKYIKSEELCEIANIRLEDLKIEFSHKEFQSRISKLKFKLVSENLAQNYEDPNKLIGGWLQSASHEAALRTSYKYSCIATDGTNVVHLFANM